MKPLAIMVLICIVLSTIGFTVLDRWISGGSAANPAYAMGIVLACAVLGILILSGSEELASFVGKIAAVAPLALLGYCGYASWSWDHRPETSARRALAENVRCAARKAGIAKNDRRFVNVRIGLIAEYGDKGLGEQAAIERRMRIHILPDCQFDRF